MTSSPLRQSRSWQQQTKQQQQWVRDMVREGTKKSHRKISHCMSKYHTACLNITLHVWHRIDGRVNAAVSPYTYTVTHP